MQHDIPFVNMLVKKTNLDFKNQTFSNIHIIK